LAFLSISLLLLLLLMLLLLLLSGCNTFLLPAASWCWSDLLFCTATLLRLQGLTDKYIATWLKGKKRDSLVLATKVSCSSEQQSMRPSIDHADFSPCCAHAAREGSCLLLVLSNYSMAGPWHFS
jgi:hypothetical protein